MKFMAHLEELERRETPSALGVFALGSAYGRDDVPHPERLNPPDLSQSLANANVDGLALRATWDALESREGQFNWAYFGTQIANAAAAGKTVSLSVTAGVNTPQWVYADGAAAFNGSQHVPIPWDTTFLNKWGTFVQALGQHFANNPTVVQVKITGINSTSQETSLPYDSSNSADLTAWHTAGYTRTKVETAWQQIGDTFARAFPNKQIAAMLRPGAFPPLDANGQPIPDPTTGLLATADYQANTDLMNTGMSRYGARFVIQNNALSPGFVWQNVVNLSQQVTTGYQMLGPAVTDAEMTQGHTLTPAVGLQQAVNNAILATPANLGVPGNAKFLEIYTGDVVASKDDSALTAVLANAHVNLATHLNASAPASIASGTVFTLAVTARNASDRTSVEYPGRVHFTSSDPQATLPADYTFTAGDNGVQRFPVTLRTGATQTVTVTDMATGAITGSVTIQLLPTISGVNPASGLTSAWTVVTITGLSFSNLQQVLIGTVSVPFTFVSATKVRATAPPHAAGVVQVRVVTAQGQSALTAADQFTYFTGGTGPQGPGGPGFGPADGLAAASPKAQSVSDFAWLPSLPPSGVKLETQPTSVPAEATVSAAVSQALDAYWTAAHERRGEWLDSRWEDVPDDGFRLVAE